MDEFDGVALSCSGIVGSNRGTPSRPVLPCTCSAVTRRLHQRPVAAGKDADVAPSGQFADDAGVPLRQRQRYVARHGG